MSYEDLSLYFVSSPAIWKMKAGIAQAVLPLGWPDDTWYPECSVENSRCDEFYPNSEFPTVIILPETCHKENPAVRVMSSCQIKMRFKCNPQL